MYGLLIAAAIAIGVALMSREEKRLGLPRDLAIDLALCVIPAALVGARIYYVIFRWEIYRNNLLSALYFWQGGLAIYGGVIGGFIGLWLLSKKRHLKLLTLLDVAAPVVILGQAIGLWGNFFNGEAYGSPVTDPAWQFFPFAVYADGGWRLATFFYESCWNLLGFILLWLYRKRARREGNVFFCYLAWYGLGRAFIEGLRADSLMWGPVRVSQALSLALCIGSMAIFLYRNKKQPTG
ncbi:MAG: prolipoprotein diacylglyceryl transferase [Clostridia bacterium]|nr:prolipoprotein diacylglyceryl transferase [Clostridia bacterium]